VEHLIEVDPSLLRLQPLRHPIFQPLVPVVAPYLFTIRVANVSLSYATAVAESRWLPGSFGRCSTGTTKRRQKSDEILRGPNGDYSA
jgi:hypothetical protein